MFCVHSLSDLGFSSDCSVTVSVPLPPLPWSKVAEVGLLEILLEEWLLRPLQTLASIRPTAELYRLKRKLIDGPFIRRFYYFLTICTRNP